MWEVENEPGDSGYNVTGGSFYVTGYGGNLDPTMVADAQADLQKLCEWAPGSPIRMSRCCSSSR